MENSTIDEKKERLEREKARLISKEQKIKALERKKELKKLISLGQLIVENGLDSLDKTTLLGALLEIKELANKIENLESWKNRATRHAQEMKITQSPVLVTFKAPPDKNIQSILKSSGLKWNPFRHEWQGYTHFPSLNEALIDSGANIQVISLNEE